ncbi:MAG: hypothetical protein HQL17_03700 [Candidatus Omnitrophica bacterium]|nr:hypothetical protein [Candidatus Omnitrophota bacterium]
MDILAQKRVLFVLTSLLVLSPSVAAGDLYGLTQVDYFSVHASVPKKPPSAPLWNEQDNIPKAVMMLLNEPNEDTARRYLEWSRERQARTARAQEIIDTLTASEMKP